MLGIPSDRIPCRINGIDADFGRALANQFKRCRYKLGNQVPLWRSLDGSALPPWHRGAVEIESSTVDHKG
eukprot:9472118-Pyramimonas_sp.AAC.1